MIIRLLQYLFAFFLLLSSGTLFGQVPEFQWVKMDGTVDAVINSVAYSSNGDFVYMGGSITGNGGTAFPVTVSGSAGKNGLVAKYTSSGTLVWAFSVGGTGTDEVTAVAVDGNDNVIIGGYFESTSGTNFSGTSGGSTSLGSTGAKDVFLAKYTPAGILSWVNQGTSSGDDLINHLAVDASNNIYVAGSSTGNFSYGGSTVSQGGAGDAFAMRVLSSGNLSWLRSFDTNGQDEFLGVTVLGSQVYFAGYYSGSRTFYLLGLIPLGVSSTGGLPDMMVVKYAISNGDLTDIVQFKGSGTDKITAITNDGTDLIFTGTTTGNLTIGSNSYSKSSVEIVTSKIDTALSPVWSTVTTQTGTGNSSANDIASLPNGKVIVTGSFSGTINTGLNPNQTSTGGTDGILLTYNGTTNAVTQQSKITSTNNVKANSISVKNNNEIFIGGSNIGNTTFSPLGSFSGNSSYAHPFVAKYGCTPATAVLSGASTVCSGQTTTMTITFTGPSPYAGTVTDGVDNYSFSGITSSTHTFSYAPTVTSTSSRTLTFSSFTSGSCGVSTASGSLAMTIYPPITNNTIASNMTICSGQVPSFTGSVPTGGDGSSPSYTWQYNLIGSMWPSGNNTNNLQNYTSLAINNTTKYRRAVSISGCPTHYSNEVTATVVPVIANNSISANENLCNGSSPQVITGSTPTGGTGSYTYSWIYSSDNITYYNVAPPVNSINYIPPASSTTYYYKRIVNSGPCLNDTSNAVTKYIYPNVSNNTITANQTICSGASGSTLIGSTPTGGDGSTYTYTWQVSSNNSTWSTASGTSNGINYSPPAQVSNQYYRRIAVYSPCPTTTSTSNTILIDLHPPISSNTISANQTICANFAPATLTGNSPTGGGGTTNTYLWQTSTDNITFSAAAGANTGQNYTPPVLTVTTYYRRKVTRGTCADSYSNSITITVQPVIASNTISADESLCQGVSPQLITGSTPTGGSGSGYNYTWLYSSDNVTFAEVSPSVNAINYLPSGSSVTYYYKRIVGSALCANDTSNAVEKYYYPAITNNSITADQTICSGATPATLNGSTPIGGNGSTYTYAWQMSIDNSVWTAAPGTNNGINYSPQAQTANRYYRRIAYFTSCSSVTSTSNTILVSIYAAITNNTISTNQTICINSAPGQLTGTSPTGGGGTTNTYLWQSSTDNVSFTAATGTNTGQNYTPPVLSTTTYYRRSVTRGPCANAFSNTITITVQPLIGNNTISADENLCLGVTPQTIAGTTPTGGDGSTYTYAWLFSSDGINYSNVTPPVGTINYAPPTSTTTRYYKRIVSSSLCASDTSNTVQKYVYPPIVNNSISANQTICVNTIPALLTGSTPSGGGSGTILYQWQESLDDVTFSAASGTNNTLNYQAGTATVTKFYRRRVLIGSCDTSYSASIKITVETLVANNSISAPATICSNDGSATVNGTAPSGGVPPYLYVWQSSPNGNTWSDITGASSQNYPIGLITTNVYFRRIVKSGSACAADTSSAILVQVSPAVTTNTISANQTICNNTSPSLLTGAVQTPGSFTFTWLESPTNSSFVSAAGTNTNASYQAGNLSQTTYYKRIIHSGACANDTSGTVTITVNPTLSNNDIQGDTIVCNGSTAISVTGSTVSGGGGSLIYNWETSTNGVSFSTASGTATNANYITGVLTQNLYLRRKVSSSACTGDTLISDTVLITVQAPLANNQIFSDQILCGTYTPSPLTGNAVTGGNGTPNYQWQSSLDQSTWNNTVATQNYSPSAITDTMYYRRKVTSGACVVENTSNVITVIYQNPIGNNVIAANQTICAGSSPAVLTSGTTTGGNNAYTYVWEQSTGGSWSAAQGTPSTTNFTANPLSTTTYYRRIASSSICPTDTSNAITVTVEIPVSNNSISIASAVCSNSTSDTIIGTLPQNGSGSFVYSWQESSNNTTWTTIGGASSQNYGLGTISNSTYYRRIVGSGICGADTSASILVTVNHFIDTNTIFADSVVCYGIVPNQFTGAAPTGSGFTYEWKVSTDNVSFVTANGTANTLNYQEPNALTQTHYYQRVITSGVCPSNTSNVLTITVLDTLTDNQIFDDTAICYGASATLTGTSVLGGSGSVNYLWEKSSDGISFTTPSSNFTSADFATGVLTQSTYFRRRVIDGLCAYDTSYSNTILVTVHAELTHNYALLADTICVGEDARVNFLISGDGPFSIAYTIGGVALQTNGINAPYTLTFTPSTSGILILDTLWDVHGCSILPADTFTYRVVSYPIVNLGTDTTVCNEMLFTPTYGSGDLTFTSPSFGTLPNNFPQVYAPDLYETHEFILFESVEGCVSSDTILVSFEKPIGYISAGDEQQLIIQDSTYLNATGLLANQTGYWTLISGTGTIRDSSNPNSVFADLISGVAVLEWTVEQDVCPSRSAQVTIGVGNLLIPTGFSPNNDGANDFLVIAGRENIPVVKIQVFDRWGGLVFEDDDYQSDWAGTSKSGQDLPEDTYFVIVDVGFKGIHKGYIIIRR